MSRPDKLRDEVDLPASLRDDLKRLYTPARPMPAEMDETIRFAAHQRLGDSRRTRRWAWVGGAVAACFAIFAVQHVIQPSRAPQVVQISSELSRPQRPSSPGAPLREDVDGSGRVDILDAFVLARRIDGGAGVSESFDLTGDGQVNRFDVDAVAMAAVRLKGGA